MTVLAPEGDRTFIVPPELEHELDGPLALARLERATRCWTVNRPVVSGVIAQDFDAAAKLLALQPGIGERSASRKYPELHTLQLDRVRYDIYFNRGSREVGTHGLAQRRTTQERSSTASAP